MSRAKITQGNDFFGFRVQTAREQLFGKRSRTKLARLIGITPSALLKIERGGFAKQETLERIARTLNQTRDWLLAGEGQQEEAPQVRESADRYIPILATASAALRERISYEDHGERGGERLPKDLHMIQVVGDSMIPLALSGQYVLCTHDQPADGGLAVVAIEGEDELQFKRVYFRPGGMVELFSIFQPDPKRPPPLLPRRSVKLHKVWGIKF